MLYFPYAKTVRMLGTKANLIHAQIPFYGQIEKLLCRQFGIHASQVQEVFFFVNNLNMPGTENI